MTIATVPPSCAARVSASPANRARGELKASFARVGSRTEIVGAYQAGGYRLRLPKTHRPVCEAVMINTGGGMAGGDDARLAFSCSEGAALTLTTAAAEKIYRADGELTRIGVTLAAGAHSVLEWLPQETILFDGARLHRRIDADVATEGSILLADMVVYGRSAMGETMRTGEIRDRWRVRRGGRLVFAEDLRIEGDPAALLDRSALGAGARATATLLLVAPDAEPKVDAARGALDTPDIVGGASAWNGLLAVRAISPSPDRLRAAIVRVLGALRGRPLPRLWQC